MSLFALIYPLFHYAHTYLFYLSTTHIHSCFIIQWFAVVWDVGTGCLSWLQYIYILILIFVVVAVRVVFVAFGFEFLV